MRKSIPFLILTLLNFNTFADDSSINKLFLFSEDMREVILKTPGGHPMPNQAFQLTQMQSDQMQALSGMDDSIRVHLENANSKPDCDQNSLQLTQKDIQALQKKVDERDFQLEVVVFSSDKKYEQNTLGRFMSNDYNNYMSTLYSNGNIKAANVFSIDSLIQKYKSDNPGIIFDSLSFKEKEKKLDEYLKTYLGDALPSGLLMKEMAFHRMVNNSSDWKATLNDAKDKLTSEQKIQLVSKLGGFFGNLYNYDRRDAGSKVFGEFISTEQLLDSVKSGAPGGICRDIALAQTQFLKELGFKNNYVLAYKTIAGSHATVISTDPETGKVVKFNYGETTAAPKGSGTESLVQDTSMPDHGINYRIYDTQGKPVTKVPSEVGQILKESAGGTLDREFNQRNYSLAKISFGTEGLRGNLFTGKTSTGDNIYGLAIYKNIETENTKTGFGLSVSKLESNRSLMQIDQENLYFRTNAEVSSSGLKIGSTQTKAFLGGETSFMLSNNAQTFKSGSKLIGEKQISADIEGFAGVKTTYESSDKKTSAETKIYANVYPDTGHVAKVTRPTLVLDSVVIRSGVSHALTDDTKALIDSAVVMRSYGTSLVMKAAIENEKNRMVAGTSVPLSKDMPTFLPGGERRAFLGVERATSRYILSVEFERNFDNRSNSVMLKGQANF